MNQFWKKTKIGTLKLVNQCVNPKIWITFFFNITKYQSCSITVPKICILQLVFILPKLGLRFLWAQRKCENISFIDITTLWNKSNAIFSSLMWKIITVNTMHVAMPWKEYPRYPQRVNYSPTQVGRCPPLLISLQHNEANFPQKMQLALITDYPPNWRQIDQ